MQVVSITCGNMIERCCIEDKNASHTSLPLVYISYSDEAICT